MTVSKYDSKVHMSLRKAGAAVCKCIPLVPFQNQGEKRMKLSCKYMYFKVKTSDTSK